MPGSLTVSRSLGSYEMMQYMMDHLSSCNFCIYSELTGKISESALKYGLDLARKRHPLLRVRIVKRGWWGASYVEDQVPEIPLTFVSLEKKEVIAFLESEQARKFNIHQGPLMRCTLLRHDNDESTLITTFHHSVADAMSGIYVSRDIIKAAGLKEVNEAIDLPVLAPLKSLEAYLPGSGRGLYGLFNFLRHIKSLLNASAKAEKNRLPDLDGNAPLTEQKGFIVNRRIDPELLCKVAAASKKNHTTIHCTLYAGYLTAIAIDAQIKEPKDCVIGYDVNIRNMLKPAVNEDMGLFISFLMNEHKINASNDFWNLARDIGSEKDKAFDNKALAGFSYLNKVLRGIYLFFGTGPVGQSVFKQILGEVCYIGVSNIGRIDFASGYGTLCIKNMGFSVHWGPMILTVSTFHDQMNLNLIGMKPVYSKKHVAKIADIMIELLNKNC